MADGNWVVPFNIVVAGDTLALQSDALDQEGFGRRLRSAYNEKSSVYNLGIERASTKSYLDFVRSVSLAAAMPKENDLVVVMLGTEDSADSSRSAISPDAFAANLEEIVRRFQKYTPNVVVHPPPPVAAGAPNHSDPAVVEEFANRARGVAESTGSAFLDVRSLMKEGDSIYVDGSLRLNTLGNQYEYDLLKTYVDNTFHLKNWYTYIWDWYICPDGLEYTNDRKCSCPVTSRHEGDTDVCVVCPASARQDATKKSCDCSLVNRDYVYDAAANECVCRQGMAQAGAGCFLCPGGSVLDAVQRTCVCSAANTVFSAERFACECAADSYLGGAECLKCPPGSGSDAGGLGCSCPVQGQSFRRDLGVCECADNFEVKEGACAPCGDGSYRVSGMDACAGLPRGVSTTAFGLGVAGVVVGGLLIGGAAGWLVSRLLAQKKARAPE